MVSRTRSRALFILLLETGITASCGIAAILIRFRAEAPMILERRHTWMGLLLSMVVVQGSFYIFDLYDFQRLRQRVTVCVRVSQAIGLASITLAVLFYAVPQVMLGRGVFLVSLLLMLSVMTLWRFWTMWLLGHPKLAERVLILGTGKAAVDIARVALERIELGYHIVGFVGDDPTAVGKSLINPKVVGLTSNLEELVRSNTPDRIVVAVGDQRGRLPLDPLLRLKLQADVAVEDSTSFYERLTGKISTDMLRPSWLIFAGTSRHHRLYKRTQRLIDVLCALIGLVLSAPIMALTAALIRLESRGSVLYTQERVGAHNRAFTIFKFRSMKVDAEKNGPTWASESDPRTTRIGRVIRKLRIDELPQFVNVLRGDMSFIGPRPERPVFVQELERQIPFYPQRHLIKPGLTGWAQIRYPYGASLEDAVEKLQYDLYYIKNQSLLLDAIILFETVRIVLFGRGAR